MAHCYLFALCRGSSLDDNSNNLTLFELIEEITVGTTSPGEANIVLPIEMHSYWLFSDDERGQEFEWRCVAVGQAGEMPSKAFDLSAEKQRNRHRVRGVPMMSEGANRLFPEWRLKGEATWHRSALYWPLVLKRNLTAPAGT